MLNIRRASALASGALLGAGCILGAQATTIPATRQLGATLATSSMVFKSITSVRALNDGRVVVQDATGRQVSMLDAALSAATPVLDSAAGKANSYPGGGSSVLASGAGLLRHVADSSMFVDGKAQAILVIDPKGNIVRTMALPTPTSANYLAPPILGLYGFPGVSAAFGLVYEASLIPNMAAAMMSQRDTTIIIGDTSLVVGYNLSTRKVDTVARFSNGRGTPQRFVGGRLQTDRPTTNASLTQFRFVDTWVLMADGSIGIVRARDYRIDWVNPDRTTTSSPRIAHEWVHNTDSIKVHMVDSLARVAARADSVALASFLKDSTDVASGKGTAAQNTRMRGTDISAVVASAGVTLDDAGMASLREMLPKPFARPTPRPRVLLSDVPDYMPVMESVSGGSVRPDADNNIWIRTRPAVRVTGAVIWDVINRQGVLVDRVSVPTAKTIVGFGPGGVVYLSSRLPNATITGTITPPAGAAVPFTAPATPATIAYRLEKVQWKQ